MGDGTSFTYDSNGNRTQKTKGTDTWVYTYDYVNNLIKVEKNSETIGECVYDGSGRRIQVDEDGVTTTYLYSGLNVLYEENTTGSACFIYGPTGKIAKRTTISGESTLFYYHSDHLGSTRLVTDSSKNGGTIYRRRLRKLPVHWKRKRCNQSVLLRCSFLRT